MLLELWSKSKKLPTIYESSNIVWTECMFIRIWSKNINDDIKENHTCTYENHQWLKLSFGTYVHGIEVLEVIIVV